MVGELDADFYEFKIAVNSQSHTVKMTDLIGKMTYLKIASIKP